jgi:hypothetical protein
MKEEVREALDLLDPYCRPTWYVDEFRSHQRHVVNLGHPWKVNNKICA